MSSTRYGADSPSGFSDITEIIRGHSQSRSESRNSRRSVERKNSNSDISSRNTVEHTIETPETQFIRAVTGRGSIKRGPAPTKASQLRQLVSEAHVRYFFNGYNPLFVKG